ncbi:MAG: hypothetical protein C0594_09305 [Marinilabiliales bacterium]|nr:MAG: hypothetical protein C0594_09305 [Marinilabiliales bacterium]
MEKQKKKALFKRRRFWMWMVLPFILVLLIVFQNPILAFNDGVFILMVQITIFYFFYMLFSSMKNFYNGSILGITFALVGLIFKFQHWPAASMLLIVGLLGLAFGSIYTGIKALRQIKTSLFLKWFTFFIGIDLFIFSVGVLFKMQSWPGGGVFSYVGVFFFFIAVLALIFTLPSSNYIDWLKLERKIFYRSIIVPMFFMIGLFLLVFVFSASYYEMMYQGSDDMIWYMVPIEYFDKEGLIL